LVKQQPYSFKVDIWALGCVLYHLTCLQAPFKGENLIVLGNNIVSKEPKPLPSVYSAWLQTFISRLMSKKPADRPTTQDMIKQLSDFLKKEPGTTLTASEEETALTTIEGTISKPIKPSKSIKITAQPTYKKPLNKEIKVPKENIVKVINPEMQKDTEVPHSNLPKIFSHKMIIDKKPHIETPLIIPTLPDKEVKQETKRNNNEVIDNKNTISSRESSHEAKCENDIKMKSILYNNAIPTTIENKRTKLYYSFGKVLSFSSRIEEARKSLILSFRISDNNSQKNKPTLSLFRSTFSNASPNDLMSNRPTSAVIKDFRPLQNIERKHQDIPSSNKEFKLPQWQRPQSAMPLGKPVALPIVEPTINKASQT